MSTKQSPGTGPLCARCQQPLPAGNTYCVACGFQNQDDVLIGRQLDIDNKLVKLQDERSFLRKLLSFFGVK